MTSFELLERIRQVLGDYTPRQINHPTAMPAAVLVLICEQDGELHLLFTERTEQVEHHKGQISFPGGAQSAEDESLAITALRESFEEIGVRPEDVEIIGQLDDILTASNFRVTPFVGLLSARSEYPFLLNGEEVAQLVRAPLAFLMDDRNMELEVREQGERVLLTPAFSYNGHRIWGATARILHQFIELLR